MVLYYTYNIYIILYVFVIALWYKLNGKQQKDDSFPSSTSLSTLPLCVLDATFPPVMEWCLEMLI